MKKIKNILIASILLLSFTACNDWFDVHPKTQVKGDDLFKTESGYLTALTGVYSSMTSNVLYGENLTLSYFDSMAGYFDISSESNRFYYFKNFRYDEKSVQSAFEQVFYQMYKAIANDNNLLRNIEKNYANTDRIYFKAIKAQAIGLRAYLHFDLLRMFGPVYSVAADSLAIPYISDISYKPVAAISSKEYVEKVLKDIDEAIALLDEIDPVSPNYVKTALTEKEEKVFAHNETRINYWSLIALKARVCLWKGDKVEAAKYAGLIVPQKDYSVPSAMIFSLFSDKIDKYSDDIFGNRAYSRLYMTSDMKESLYEVEKYGVKDARGRNFVSKYPSSVAQTVVKYRPEGIFAQRIPLIRSCEMYYILAECASSDKDALVYLNKVRNSYGIEKDDNLKEGECDVHKEILKEYNKSFVGEGQMFYCYKRLNESKMLNQEIEHLQYLYKIPVPDTELEFGVGYSK